MSIRPAVPQDAAAFITAVRRSRSLHGRWVTPPKTVRAYRTYLRGQSAGTHQTFLVVHMAGGQLAGVITIGHIVRGPLRSAYVGYYAFRDFAGRGLMKQGMRLVLRHAFAKLKLHRLEANIQPENRASIALARSCGFSLEGYSRRYLKVSGRWRHHQRWAILADDSVARARHSAKPMRAAAPSP